MTRDIILVFLFAFVVGWCIGLLLYYSGALLYDVVKEKLAVRRSRRAPLTDDIVRDYEEKELQHSAKLTRPMLGIRGQHEITATENEETI